MDSELIKVVQDIAGASSERRAGTMRRLAGFLLSEGARLSEAQIQVFDQLLLELVNSCDTQELTELAGKLAAVAFAPASTIKHLASHSDIRVAGPVLNDSPRLSNDDLLEVAAAHGQKHLLAISRRNAIDEMLTDVLIELGNRDVRYSVAANDGAKLTAKGFKHLVASAEGDALLAEKTGLRADLPSGLLTALLQRSSSAVGARLLALSPAHRREEIQRVVALVEPDVQPEQQRTHDFRSASDFVQTLKREGRLTESKLAEFARARHYEPCVVALATLAAVPIELVRPLMRAHRSDGLVVACRAAELGWDTTELVIRSRLTAAAADLAKLRRQFDELSVTIAKRTLTIWKDQALGPRRLAS